MGDSQVSLWSINCSNLGKRVVGEMFEAGFLERGFLHAASYCDVEGLYFRMSVWGTPLSFSPKGHHSHSSAASWIVLSLSYQLWLAGYTSEMASEGERILLSEFICLIYSHFVNI